MSRHSSESWNLDSLKKSADEDEGPQLSPE
jgi:hypothetical protein